MEGALKLGTVRLLDYVNDLVDFVKTLDEPPIIGGVSMGGLLAQLVAARIENKGVLLLSPAPAWGMFPFYPSMLRTFYKHFLQWGFWRKPLYPHWEEFRWSVVNEQTEEKAKEFFYSLKLESGRATWIWASGSLIRSDHPGLMWMQSPPPSSSSAAPKTASSPHA
ncbi:alpha/beta fold hydrolase [Pseudovibrio denitrificans]|uniref:alpha/beta fold hydrolase n=1 Tax=Pseudovibrio denitrificans TaxID=258256 RepID=UPI001AD93840|nr:alpha/beta fold hydrolase [Pseudovibrio denitrificans]